MQSWKMTKLIRIIDQQKGIEFESMLTLLIRIYKRISIDKNKQSVYRQRTNKKAGEKTVFKTSGIDLRNWLRDNFWQRHFIQVCWRE